MPGRWMVGEDLSPKDGHSEWPLQCWRTTSSGIEEILWRPIEPHMAIFFPELFAIRLLHAAGCDLYKNDQCRQCHAMTEDNEHIWLCPESKEAHDEVWKDGLERIDFLGTIAAKRYNKDRKKSRREGEAKPKEIERVTASVRDYRRALRRIIQWPSTEDNYEGYMGDEKWMVCHIFGGLVPKALATEWAGVFVVPGVSKTSVCTPWHSSFLLSL